MNDTTPAPSSRATIVAFFILALAVAGGIVLLLVTRPEPVEITIHPPLPTGTPLPPSPLTVYVTGAVANPETLHTLPQGSRVLDAIDAAGGTTDLADMSAVNLAGILHDGDQIHVPALGEVETALAQAILDYRQNNGKFANLQALDDVSGIGPAMLEQLEGFISFE
jgi:competence protein ComEA